MLAKRLLDGLLGVCRVQMGLQNGPPVPRLHCLQGGKAHVPAGATRRMLHLQAHDRGYGGGQRHAGPDLRGSDYGPSYSHSGGPGGEPLHSIIAFFLNIRALRCCCPAWAVQPAADDVSPGWLVQLAHGRACGPVGVRCLLLVSQATSQQQNLLPPLPSPIWRQPRCQTLAGASRVGHV